MKINGRRNASAIWRGVRTISHSWPGKVGVGLSLSFLVLATFSGFIATQSPTATDSRPYLSPSFDHLLGTDDLGQDIFSQLVWATRGSLLVAVTAGGIASLLGVTVGLLSGYYGGKSDDVLMRFTDVVLVLPLLPLLIVIAAYFPPSIFLVVLVIGLLSWPITARIIRSQTLTLRTRPFVDTCRLSGMSDPEIIFRIILPMQISLVIVNTVISAVYAVVIEAGLDFIGLAPANTLSWGIMLYFALSRSALVRGLWWWFLPPGLMIALLGVGLILLGTEVERVLKVRQ
jgi:ABC-type dipeptide/oligopeptide/nickel transport system permease subunit